MSQAGHSLRQMNLNREFPLIGILRSATISDRLDPEVREPGGLPLLLTLRVAERRSLQSLAHAFSKTGKNGSSLPAVAS